MFFSARFRVAAEDDADLQRRVVCGAGLDREPVDGLAFDDDFVDLNLSGHWQHSG
jgi:hypothetical protein